MRDVSQYFIALHESGDKTENKRSVSEIISGAEHASGSITSRKLSEFKVRGCLYIDSGVSVLNLPLYMTKLAIYFIHFS